MIIDVNANLERWPFRRTPCDEVPTLLEKFRQHGIGQAWVGSLDGIFHRDIGAVNIRLANACRSQKNPVLLPFGSINPLLPDWREDLRRCHEQFEMPGVRLHPSFPGYALKDPIFVELLDACARRRLIVQLVIRMDDVRVQHPLINVGDVDVAPLAPPIKDRPDLRLVILNGASKIPAKTMTALAGAGHVYFDIATQEIVGGVAALASQVTAERVLLGSHLPLFPLESAVLKVREAGFDESTRDLIESGNALRLLAH